MLSKETKTEIVNVLKLFGPIPYRDFKKWDQLHLLLSQSIREVKRMRSRDLRSFVVTLMFEIKQNKFSLAEDIVQNLCYPYLVELLHIKVKVVNTARNFTVSNEKLTRQNIIIKYLLSKDFDQVLWNKLHEIAKKYPGEYHYIRADNPQYGLSTKEISCLNRLSYRKKNPLNIPLINKQSNWLSKNDNNHQKELHPNNENTFRSTHTLEVTTLNKNAENYTEKSKTCKELPEIENASSCSNDFQSMDSESYKANDTNRDEEFNLRSIPKPQSPESEISSNAFTHSSAGTIIDSQEIVENSLSEIADMHENESNDEEPYVVIYLSSDSEDEDSIPLDFYTCEEDYTENRRQIWDITTISKNLIAHEDSDKEDSSHIPQNKKSEALNKDLLNNNKGNEEVIVNESLLDETEDIIPYDLYDNLSSNSESD